MELNQVMNEVNDIFREVLENDDIQVQYETTANDIAEWDSLNHIHLVVEIERHFGIRFKADELVGYKNVGDMCEAIVRKKS
jgi:acyl carrier protein